MILEYTNKKNIMKRTKLLIAVLFTGMVCEAAIQMTDNLENAKEALMYNYSLPVGSVKEWKIK